MAAKFNGFWQGATGCEQDLLLHQIHAGYFFRHTMFHLDTRIHFRKPLPSLYKVSSVPTLLYPSCAQISAPPDDARAVQMHRCRALGLFNQFFGGDVEMSTPVRKVRHYHCSSAKNLKLDVSGSRHINHPHRCPSPAATASLRQRLKRVHLLYHMHTHATPAADGFTTSGKPMALAASRAAAASLMRSLPAKIGMPRSAIMRRAFTLSPIRSSQTGSGPIKVNPASLAPFAQNRRFPTKTRSRGAPSRHCAGARCLTVDLDQGNCLPDANRSEHTLRLPH